ncbi:Mu-like prophage major head subunit gpT family protein [Pseudomonas solani]|uniref:Mu-like prophage major head subunit gpT family protein n=1 Tax=Pseudomonas solani TaxID=2731552 RepID=UPI0035BE2932
MAVVTPALLKALFAGYSAAFKKGQSAPSMWTRVATLVPSTTASNIYAWLGKFPKLQEWIGARAVKNMAAHGYTIVNKKFESTVGVPRDAVEDDSAGVYLPLFEEMGRAATEHPDLMIFGLLADGFSELCYDGQNFFDTEHPVYPNVDGTGTATLVSNMDVPSSNPGPAWFLLDTTRAIKPLIFQERTKPELESKTNPANSDHVFDHDEYVHGIRYRCNGGFGFWQMAYASRQPLTPENYEKARTALQELKADGGTPLGIRPDLLVVPPSLEGAAKKIVVKDKDGGNEWAGTAEVLNCPWLV